MKFIFAIAIVVASTAMTQVDYAYALDCSATNLSKQEQGICAVRAAVSANAKTAPVLTTPTTAPDKIIAKNRCAGIVGKALADCNRVKK